MTRAHDLLVLAHLALWAQIGVMMRVYLSKIFVLGCSGSWGPCLAGSNGVYTGSLPANMLGSLIMGALAAASVLELESKKPVTILPAGHPWQLNVPLHIGLRTGLCGSLTTFGTWQVEVMTLAIRDNAWVNAVVAFFIGLSCSLISYVVGMHVALAVDRHLLAPEGEGVLEQRESFRVGEVAAELGGAAQELGSPEQESELQLERDLPRSSVRRSTEATVEESASATDKFMALYAGKKTHAATVLLLAAVLAGWSVGLALEEDHLWVRTSFLSSMLGIFGCWLRYVLAQSLNYQGQSRWPWYPMGTLAANMLGTAIDFGLQALLTKRGPSLGYWGGLVVSALQTGLCGALTTVSTLVAEIVKFSSLFPEEAHVYWYSLHTFGGGLLLGIAIYGWAGWTA